MSEIKDAEIVEPGEEQKPPEPPKQEEKKESTNLPSTILIGADGRIVAKNNVELMRYCGALTLGGGVPERFNTAQKLFAALMFVRDLRLPDTAIRQVANIHGVMNIFGDLPLALCQRTKELIGFKEIWFDRDYNEIRFENKNLHAEVWGATVFMARKPHAKERDVSPNSPPPEEIPLQSFSFTLEDAKTAGLYPCLNPNKPWTKYTKMMLRYRARTIGLKSLFADALSGVCIGEYDNHLMLEEGGRDVTPENDKPHLTLDDKLRAEEEAQQKNQ